jgi:hypothetical protein
MTIEGAISTPREKGLMSSSRTDSTDKRIYCAVRQKTSGTAPRDLFKADARDTEIDVRG